jgi:hypothetical protein
MYSYTELPQGNGLLDVHVNTGIAERAVCLSDLTSGLLVTKLRNCSIQPGAIACLPTL